MFDILPMKCLGTFKTTFSMLNAWQEHLWFTSPKDY